MKSSVQCLQRPLLACVLIASVLFAGCASKPAVVNAVLPPTYADLMASAEEAHRKGGVVEAMDLYEKAAKADPSKKQPWARIAQAQFDARNYGAAITAAQEVLLRDTTDLTANARAPLAKGNPFTYFDPAGNQVVLIFRGSDNQVRSLYWMFGAVGHDNLTGSINPPKAAGDPAGWFSSHDAFHHVVYRTSDGHLHELWWQGQGGVGHGDLTAQARAVSAAGDPWPYYDPVRATNIVAFRGVDGKVLFGVNLIPELGDDGRVGLAIGDAVEILS